MADEPHVIRGINWRETFTFTHLFRTFRIAIHPSKLLLALVAIVVVYTAGRVMDGVWPAEHRAVPGEIALYEQSLGHSEPARMFKDSRQRQRQQFINENKRELERIGKPDGGLSDIRRSLEQQRRERLEQIEQTYAEAIRKADADYEASDKTAAARELRDERRRTAREARRLERQRAHERARELYRQFARVRGESLFVTFYDYQVTQLDNVARAAISLDFMGPGGVIQSLGRFLTVGPAWALRHHPVYFTLFLLILLAVWSVFGGAIARIAAVHVARDEKISIRGALTFATDKFLSFFSAPLIPLIIIIALGLIVAAGGLLTNVPWLGPIVVGALFFLALGAALVMTLVLIGLVGGFNLMYPTIAVEGSDSFDAISRSFSYLYAKPWRLAFLTFIALIYGAVTYVFITLFARAVMVLSHYFAGMWVFVDAPDGRPLWNVLWPIHAANGLSYQVDFFTLNWAQSTGAFLIAFWVHLLIGLVGAFVISFYFSANTIIYYLLRNEVDATELDEVYLEQADEDFGDTEPTKPVTSTATASTEAAKTSTASDSISQVQASSSLSEEKPSGESPSNPQPPAPTDQPPAPEEKPPQT